jgi:TolB protein
MTNLKRLLIVCLAGACIFTSLFMSSCAATYSNGTAGSPGLITFSANDNNIVHVFIIKPDGTNQQPTSGDNMTKDWYPAWSPDGKKIVFSSNESDDYEIWTMNADGSNRQRITNRPGLDTLPRWSPDGRKIVFTSTFRDIVNDKFSYDICVVDFDGSNYMRLTHGSHEFHYDIQNNPVSEVHCSCDQGPLAWNNVPTWSPDGSKVLFASNDAENPAMPYLYTMNADSSDRNRMGFMAGIVGSQPDWSPVNNQIIFTRWYTNKSDIWVIDAGALFPEGTAIKITNNNYNNQSPVWSPDGKQIAFVSDQYGMDNIFIMNADGTNVHRLTNSKSEEIHPSWR